MTYEAKLDPQGRLHIPASVRSELGLKPGERVVADVKDQRLIVESRESVARRLRGRLKGKGNKSAVDQLIEQRRKEAKDISQ